MKDYTLDCILQYIAMAYEDPKDREYWVQKVLDAYVEDKLVYVEDWLE